MDNSAKYNEILNDYSSGKIVYECLLCGHEQPIDEICECCGSYALEQINLDTSYE
jgi:hypothetical protein